MRNIHLIEQFMKENNLKYDEPFIIKWKWFKEYKDIQKKGIVKIIKRICNGKSFVSVVSIEGFDDSENTWVDDREDMSNPLDKDKLLYDILFNDTNVQVIKIPFKPKNGEEYYRIVRGWDIIKDIFSESNVCDCAFFLIGNCFRTREEAEANLEKIKKLCKRNKPLIDLNEVE
ncbi:hypothetical protein [Megamonas funiformis]|uniref:hypothetical protein n=1 Tax=Megamonas funiformis TaxID=437897 RepID=UPI003F7D030E